MSKVIKDFRNLLIVEFWQFKNKIKNAFVNPITAVKTMFFLLIGILILIDLPKDKLLESSSTSKNLNSDLLGAAAMIIALTALFITLYKASKKYTPVQFLKSDVYYLFPSPISPRAVYMWTLIRDSFKDLYIWFVCIIVYWSFVSKHFSMDLSRIIVTLYAVFLLEIFCKAFAFLVYLLSNKFKIKKFIKAFNFIFGLLLAVYTAISLIKTGFNSKNFYELLNGKVFSNIPMVGWTKDMLVHPNVTGKEILFQTVMLSIIVIITIALTAYFAVDYYELIAEYLETNDNVWVKNKKEIDEDNINKNLGKIDKLNIKGEFAFLWKANLEWRRTVKFYYGYIGAFIVSCVLGIILKSHETKDIMAAYLVIGWQVVGILPNISSVKYELGKSYIYLIPGSFIKKTLALYIIPILGKTLFNALIIVPFGIIVKMSLIQVVLIWLTVSLATYIILFSMLLTNLMIPIEYDKEFGFTSFLNYLFLSPPTIVGVLIGIKLKSIILGLSYFCITSIVILFLVLIISKKLFSKLHFNY